MSRAATIDDLAPLTLLGGEFFRECPNWRAMQYDAERFADRMRELIEHQAGFVQVVEMHGALVGVMVAQAERHWCCRDVIVHEHALYVDRAHRGGMAASRLIVALIEWSAAIGAQRILVSASTGVNNELVAKLYERHGFKRHSIGLEL